MVETETPEVPFRNISVVQEFSDVFPEEISGMPPPKEVEFCIDLIRGSTPISKGPHRMALAELKELKTLVGKITRKGLHKSQHVTMGVPVLFVKKDGALGYALII